LREQAALAKKQRLQEIAATAQALDEDATLAQILPIIKAELQEIMKRCEIPVQQLISFLQSTDAQQTLTRISSNPDLWRAYDATVGDVRLSNYPEAVNLDNLARNLVIQNEMIDDLSDVVKPYGIDLRDTDTFEHSLAIRFGANERPQTGSKFFHFDTYAMAKRNFCIRTQMNLEATQRMIDNINAIQADAAAIINEKTVEMRLAYTFVRNHFMPGFAEFLAQNPVFIAEMQAQYQLNSQARKMEMEAAMGAVQAEEEQLTPTTASTKRPRNVM
jgi:hypothetical protein